MRRALTPCVIALLTFAPVTASIVAPASSASASEVRLPAMPQAPRFAVDRVVRVPKRIARDGSADVTDALSSFIGKQPAGTRIVFPDRATYRVEGTLWIRNARNLIIDGNGSRIVATTAADRERRHVRVYGGSNIVIRELTVRGPNTQAGTDDDAWQLALEAQHGFELDGVQGAVLEDVKVTDVYGDFVYIGMRFGDGDVKFIPSRNIHVVSSHFERNGRSGITPNFCEDVLIKNNYIGEVRRATFNMEPPAAGWSIDNVRIVGNTTGDGRLLWLAGGGKGDNVGNILIARNTMLRDTNSGGIVRIGANNDVGGYRGPYVIRDNIFDAGQTPWGLFSFERVRGIEIHDNVVRLPSGGTDSAVMLRDAHDASVTGNNFRYVRRVFDADAASSNYSEKNNAL
jgi:hypothetical protein